MLEFHDGGLIFKINESLGLYKHRKNTGNSWHFTWVWLSYYLFVFFELNDQDYTVYIYIYTIVHCNALFIFAVEVNSKISDWPWIWRVIMLIELAQWMTWCWVPSITRHRLCSHWVQVYPEGNQSNNNQFLAAATGTISAIDGLKVLKFLHKGCGDDVWQIIGISTTSDIFSVVGLAGLVSSNRQIKFPVWLETPVVFYQNPEIQPKSKLLKRPIELKLRPHEKRNLTFGKDRYDGMTPFIYN